MTEKKTISWSTKVQVTGGPNYTIANVIEVEAYDLLSVEVKGKSGGAATNNTAKVAVQPGGADQVQFILIKPDRCDAGISCEIGGQPKYTLDAPLMLSGAGAIKLLGDTQKPFVFTNDTANDLSIEILVGRKATTA